MNRRDPLIAGGAVGAMSITGQSQAQTASGFFVPPEEAPHQRTFMQWPVSRRVHPDPVFLGMAQKTIADIANTIAEFEPVTMLVEHTDHAGASAKLSNAVELWDIPTEDLWCRDAGSGRLKKSPISTRGVPPTSLPCGHLAEVRAALPVTQTDYNPSRGQMARRTLH